MKKTDDALLFSEFYNCYYHTVARILEEARQCPLTRRQIEHMARIHGHDESALYIVPKLIRGDWPFLEPDPSGDGRFRSVLNRPLFPQPLTRLQKSWLRSLMEDPRFCLFFTDSQLAGLKKLLADVKPLYRTSDFCLFDQYEDHDPFSSAMYRKHMQTILAAVSSRQFLSVSYLSGKGNIISHRWLPCRLEYGQRDGKFRLCALAVRKNGRPRLDLLNVARILSLKETGDFCPRPVDVDRYLDRCLCREPLVLEITTERNGLERTMLHFSCYQKKVERLEDRGTYRCTIYYDTRWETELLIQVLSFGPVVKVLGPESFVRQIRERVEKQQILTYDYKNREKRS